MRPRLGRLVVACALAAAALAIAANAASALKLCLPKAEGSALLTPKHGKCKKGYKLTGLSAEGKEGKSGKEGKAGAEGKEGKQGGEGKAGPEGKLSGFSSAELETLKALFPLVPYIKVVPKGIDEKPTVEFSGANVQIVNGEGKTATTNGTGNLVIGYDEHEGGRPQGGSHNLILGEDQGFTSYGGFLAGEANFVSGAFASVSGGLENEAHGFASSVAAGEANVAFGSESSVTGGFGNEAVGSVDTVAGGFANNAGPEEGASVTGGEKNEALGVASSVSGGEGNKAKGKFSSILGGEKVTLETEFGTSP